MSFLTIVAKHFFRPGDVAGFTLLEIMVSVSIIALVFVSLFRMQSETTDLALAGQFNSIAPFLARQLLVDIEQDLVNRSESEGDFGENYPGYEWVCKITDASFEDLDFLDETSQGSFKKIVLEISGMNRQRVYKITTWRFALE